jgi:hypothetical protein
MKILILGHNHSHLDDVKDFIQNYKKENTKSIFFLEGDKSFDVSRVGINSGDKIFFEGDTLESFLVQLIYAFNFVCLDMFAYYSKIVTLDVHPFHGSAKEMYLSLPKEETLGWHGEGKTKLLKLIKLVIDNLFLTDEEKTNYKDVFEKILTSCNTDKILNIPLQITDFLRDKNMSQKISSIACHYNTHKRKYNNIVVIVGEKHGKFMKALLEEMSNQHDVTLHQLHEK